LTDSLRADRKAEASRIANANLMPSYLPRMQYKEDSIRARFYFNLTKDSAYIKKYLHKPNTLPVEDTLPSKKKMVMNTIDMLDPKKQIAFKKKNTLTR